MGVFTRRYGKFDWWSVEDCDCKYCLYYKGKKRGCSLEECCCEDIRAEAVRREQAAKENVETRTGVAT